VVAQPNERHANRTNFLCWSGKTDTEHITTSGSNKEEMRFAKGGA